MEQMAVPRIEKTAGKFFDASWPDYTELMLRAGTAKAEVDLANEDRVLKAQQLQLEANNSAFDKLIAMAELGVQMNRDRMSNDLGQQRNSIDWFRAGLEADQQRLNSALAMEKLELARRDINSQIATRSAAYTGATGATTTNFSNPYGLRASVPRSAVLGQNPNSVNSGGSYNPAPIGSNLSFRSLSPTQQ